MVDSASGSVLQRNRRDIRETAEKHLFLSTDDDRQRNFREGVSLGFDFGFRVRLSLEL